MKDVEADRRGARDAAAILPFVCVVLLFPPLVYIFAVPVKIAGVPLVITYLFGVWAVIIAIAFLVSRRLELNEREAERLPASKPN